MARKNSSTLAITFLATLSLFSSHTAQAKLEKALGLGFSFYSGSENKGLTPNVAPHLSFSANLITTKTINLVNRFELGALADGQNFGGIYGKYTGFEGTYAFAPRLN